MPRRSYHKDRRAEIEAETTAAIVEATLALHAEHGIQATSYAMIADRAEVSPQTIYNKFPSRGALLAACMGHAAESAPQLDVELFGSEPTATARVRKLVDAVFDQHAYFANWARWAWREAQAVPELKEAFDAEKLVHRRLITLAFTTTDGSKPSHRLVEVATVLLSYPSWEQLTQARSSKAAAEIVGECLAALLVYFEPRSRTEVPVRRK